MQLEERGREGGGVRACGLSLKKRRRREGNAGDSHNKRQNKRRGWLLRFKHYKIKATHDGE